LQVLVGNDNSLVVERLVKELEVNIQGQSLKLRYTYCLFGKIWFWELLSYLHRALTYLITINLKFFLNNEFITLHGETSKLPSSAQFTHLKRMHTQML